MELTKREGNWVLTLKNNIIESIAIEEGCKDSQFGTLQHLIGLIFKGYYKKDRFTADGLQIIENHINKSGYTLEELFK